MGICLFGVAFCQGRVFMTLLPGIGIGSGTGLWGMGIAWVEIRCLTDCRFVNRGSGLFLAVVQVEELLYIQYNFFARN